MDITLDHKNFCKHYASHFSRLCSCGLDKMAINVKSKWEPGKALRIPCHKNNLDVPCSQRRFYTSDELKDLEKDMSEIYSDAHRRMNVSVKIAELVRAGAKDHGIFHGALNCPECKSFNAIFFAVSFDYEHVHIGCSKCHGIAYCS